MGWSYFDPREVSGRGLSELWENLSNDLRSLVLITKNKIKIIKM